MMGDHLMSFQSTEQSNLNIAAIVLAAGEGKRMKSKLSKVLHPIAGIPMIKRTINILKAVKPTQIIVVVNQKNDLQIKKLLGKSLEHTRKIRDEIKKKIKQLIKEKIN